MQSSSSIGVQVRPLQAMTPCLWEPDPFPLFCTRTHKLIMPPPQDQNTGRHSLLSWQRRSKATSGQLVNKQPVPLCLCLPVLRSRQ